MTAAEWIVIGVAIWLASAVVVGVVTGRRLQRRDGRRDGSQVETTRSDPDKGGATEGLTR